MKLSDRIILKRLKKNGIDVSLQELCETINIYKRVLDFYFEDRKERSDSFGFLYTPIKLYTIMDKYFFNIFSKILEMKRKGLLKYLDYALLLDCNPSLFETELRQSIDLLQYLEKVCNADDFIMYSINRDECFIENVTDNYLDNIIDDEIIPDNYKQMIKLYSEIFRKFYNEGFYELNFDEFDYDIGLDHIVNCSYYYFLKNDFFSNNMDEVMSFLNDINDNMGYYIDKINMFGLDSEKYENCLTLVDYLFKNRNKVMIKK